MRDKNGEPIVTSDPGRNSGGLTLLDLVNVALGQRWLIVGLPLLLFVTAVSWSLSRDRSYTAHASFTPQNSNKSQSGLASVAAQFGVLVSGATSESPAWYADLVHSRDVLGPVVDSTYTAVIGQKRLAGNLVQIFQIEDESPAVGRELAIKTLREVVIASPSLETGNILLAVTTPSAELSAAISTRILDEINDFNVRRRQGQANAERTFVDARMKQAREELLTAEQSLQYFLQHNRVWENSPQLAFQHDRLEREVMMRQEVYTTLAQAYEQARIEEVRNLPVVAVLERPVPPVQPDPRGTVVRGALALLAGLVLALLIAFIREFMRSGSTLRRPDYVRFHELRQEALDEVLHPIRRLRRTWKVRAH
jgi:uncharacterized protein involved in exopolysaccharide biosynthesis